MIKNMTRKGLAIGSAAALIVAGFAGALPAQAATSVTLNASAGSQAATQNGILGQTFNMASTAVGATADSRVRYFVEGASAAEVTVEGRFVTDLTSGAGYANLAGKTDLPDGLAKAMSFSAVGATNLTTGQWLPGNFLQLNISLASSVTTTTTIKITPFIDNVVNDDEITAGEFAGTPITLTFHKGSEITATTTLGAVSAGDTSLKAVVTLDKDINMRAIGANSVYVHFTEDGNPLTTPAAAFVVADAGLVASHAPGGFATSASSVYTAQARVGGDAGANNSGSASVVQAGVGKISTLSTIAVAKGTSYRATGSASNDAVRSGAGTVVVSTNATDANGAVAGGTVTFTIEETAADSIDVAGSVTAGGKTLSGTPTTAQKISVDVTTDADGDAELSIAYAGLKNLNTFKVTISAYSADGKSVVTTTSGRSDTVTFTANDSVATALVDLNKLGGPAGNNPVHATTVGGPVSIAYQLVDQFGQTPAGTFRFRTNAAANGGAIINTLAVTSGRANLSFSDNSDAVADGGYNVTADNVQKLGTDGTSWTNVGGVSVVSAVALVSALPAATRLVVAETPNTTATTAANSLNKLSSAALQTVDARLALESADRPELNLGSPFYNSVLSGTVFGATGAAQAGASVTLSSPNLMFVTGSGATGGTAATAHYSLGSTTIKTDANGAWGDVRVLSTTAGKHTVTVTSGSATATEDVFFGAAAHNAGSAVTITAPASVLPGSTLQISAVVTDKFGNPVNTSATGDAADVAITYTGPGLVVGTLPTETDANGRVQLSVLMGSNDRGTFSVTVSYRKAGAGSTGTNLIAATANVTVGAAAAVAGEARGWTRFLSDKNELKIYARDVVGAGKVTFMVNGRELAWIRAVDGTDPKLNVANDGIVRSVFVRDMLVGRNVIEIYQGNVRLDRRIFTR
jgi:hypothetical protein